MYPLEMIKPMIEDLTSVGFKELSTTQSVDDVINNTGTAILVINSVCGCAAGNARPAVKMAVQNAKRPDELVTVFAGVDVDATARAREYMLPYPPSSPAIAMFKDGKLVHVLERHNIEGQPVEYIAENLVAAFAEYC